MSETKVELSLTHCCAIIPRAPDASKYAMDRVRITAEGVTESTDGTTLLRVYPKKYMGEVTPGLLDGKVLKKAGREAQRKTARCKNPLPVVLDTESNTLSYTTPSKTFVVLPHASAADGGPHGSWPDTDTIVADYASKSPCFSGYVGVKALGKVLRALEAAGCNSLRMEFFSPTEALRFSSEAPEAFVLGLVMPVVKAGDPNAPR